VYFLTNDFCVLAQMQLLTKNEFFFKTKMSICLRRKKEFFFHTNVIFRVDHRDESSRVLVEEWEQE
jgi:hypothetical protein